MEAASLQIFREELQLADCKLWFSLMVAKTVDFAWFEAMDRLPLILFKLYIRVLYVSTYSFYK